MDINLTLTVDEVNTILRSLGQHPFEQIAALIGKIKSQGEPQVEKLQTAAANAEAAIAAQAKEVVAE